MISFPSSPLYPAGIPFPAQINKPANLPLYPQPQPTQLPFSLAQPQGETFNFSTPVAPQALPSPATSFQTQGSNLPTQTPNLQTQEVPVTPEPGLPSTTNGWLLPALGVGAAATLAGGLIYRARSSNKKPETSAHEADTSTANAEKTVNQSETDIHTAKSPVSKSTAAHQAETDTAKAERNLAKSGIAAKAINKTKVISSTIVGTAAAGLAAYSGWLPGFRAATAATRITKDISNVYPDIFSVKPASVVAQEAMKPGHNFAASAFRKFAGIAQSPTVQSFAGRSTLYGAAGVGLAGLGMYFYQRHASKAKEPVVNEEPEVKSEENPEVNNDQHNDHQVPSDDAESSTNGAGHTPKPEDAKSADDSAPPPEPINIKDWEETKKQECKEQIKQDFASEVKKKADAKKAIEYFTELKNRASGPDKILIQLRIDFHKKELEYLNFTLKAKELRAMSEEAQQAADDHPAQKREFDTLAENYEKQMNEAREAAEEAEKQTDNLKKQCDLKESIFRYKKDMLLYPRLVREQHQKATNILNELKMENIPTHPNALVDFVKSNYQDIKKEYIEWSKKNHPNFKRGADRNQPATDAQARFIGNYDSLLKPFIATLDKKAGLVEELRMSGLSEEEIARELDPKR